MALKEKIPNAESSDWLKEGITDEEVNQIVTKAKTDARERLLLEEAIRHCEEVAESYEQQVKDEVWVKGSFSELRCIECASEHRQLAEWLKELQIYRKKLTEIEEAVNFYKGCETCQGFREYPTSEFVKDLVRILEVQKDDE